MALSGSFLSGRELTTRHLELDVDAVVIGTGAGGSIMLRELAAAGLNVVGLEEGPHLGPQDFDQREVHMFEQLYQNAAARATDDRAIRVLQGRGMGGSTVHNTNLCKRTPDAILDLWARRYRVSGASSRDLARAFETIERDLSVSQLDESWRNANNEVLRVGCEALGWRGAALWHNRIRCVQSGFCELGCTYDAKQNALKVVLPQAVASGARIFSDLQARAVEHDGLRVNGVRAVALGGDGKPCAEVFLRARVVVLAASAVGSAFLARKSGLPDPHERLGRGLRLHPGSLVVGRFDREIGGWRGIPQSYECTEFLSHEEGSDRRVWILSAFAHPVGAAATLSGFGAAHMAAMRQYRNLAVLTAMVHDETSGQVSVGHGEEPMLRYRLVERDRVALAKGLAACGRLLLAAGALEVILPSIPPMRARTPQELQNWDLSLVRAHRLPLTAVHPMGTMCMGDDPTASVVSSTGEHHQVEGLFVSDGSLFPTSIGVPPQVSIYAFAWHLAPHVIARANRSRSI